MIEYILYDLLFFGIYIGVSTWISIHEKYNIASLKFINEIKRGSKSLLVQLPTSNVVMTMALPYTRVTNEFSLMGCLYYLFFFDFLVFFIHWMFHQNKHVYKAIHHEHHITKYVSPFSATILDFKEHILIGIVPTLLPLFFVDIDLIGWTITNMLIFVHGIFIHSTYKLPYEGYLLGSHNHSLHHMCRHKNFGFLFPIWDELFKSKTRHIPRDRIRTRVHRHYEKNIISYD